MGQCGCGDTTPMYRIPGPAGITYGIEVYGSCHYCETPVGVVIYRFADESDLAVFVEGLPDAPFVPYDAEDPTDAQFAIPVLEPRALVEAYTDHFGSDEEGGPSEGNLRYALPRAVGGTLAARRRAADGGQAG